LAVAYKTKHRIRLLFIEFAAKPIMVFFTDSLVVALIYGNTGLCLLYIIIEQGIVLW